MELDPVEQVIVQSLVEIPLRARSEQWNSDRIWTEQLKSTLSAAGAKLNHYVCTTGCKVRGDAAWGEWLYDIVWLTMEDGALVDVDLILESEWSIKPGEIDIDFQKLLVGRAHHRVMIFQQETLAKVNAMFDRLTAQIIRCRLTQPGDRYLLLGLDWNDSVFTQRLFIAP